MYLKTEKNKKKPFHCTPLSRNLCKNMLWIGYFHPDCLTPGSILGARAWWTWQNGWERIFSMSAKLIKAVSSAVTRYGWIVQLKISNFVWFWDRPTCIQNQFDCVTYCWPVTGVKHVSSQKLLESEKNSHSSWSHFTPPSSDFIEIQPSDGWGWHPDSSGGCKQDLLGKRKPTRGQGLRWGVNLLWPRSFVLCSFSPLCILKCLLEGGQGAVLSFPGNRLCLPCRPWHRTSPCPTGGGQLIPYWQQRKGRRKNNMIQLRLWGSLWNSFLWMREWRRRWAKAQSIRWWMKYENLTYITNIFSAVTI